MTDLMTSAGRMSAWAQRHAPLLKKACAAGFGALLAWVVTDSIKFGAGYIFVEEPEKWGQVFWGAHHALRIVASGIGTGVGAFAVGCTVGRRGRIWGMICALPGALFWIVAAVVMLARAAMGHNVGPSTGVTLALPLLLFFVTPALGFYFGSVGSKVCAEHPDLFALEPNSALGVKWYHWIWLLFVVRSVVLLAGFFVLEGIALFSGGGHATAWRELSPFVAACLVAGGLAFLVYSVSRIFFFLILGRMRGWSTGEIMMRILGWIGGIFVVYVIFSAVAGIIRVL